MCFIFRQSDVVLAEPFFSASLLPWHHLTFWYHYSKVSQSSCAAPVFIPGKGVVKIAAGNPDLSIIIYFSKTSINWQSWHFRKFLIIKTVSVDVLFLWSIMEIGMLLIDSINRKMDPKCDALLSCFSVSYFRWLIICGIVEVVFIARACREVPMVKEPSFRCSRHPRVRYRMPFLSPSSSL